MSGWAWEGSAWEGRESVGRWTADEGQLLMGADGMPNRAQDWFRQAEKDLEQAEDSHEAGHHEWSCFSV